MSKQILVNSSPYETRVATLEDGEIRSLHIEREEDRNVVGNIYKGVVKRVLPGMQAAFLELGLERTAFLYVDDIIDEPFGTEFDYGETERDGGGDETGETDPDDGSDLEPELEEEDPLDSEGTEGTKPQSVADIADPQARAKIAEPISNEDSRGNPPSIPLASSTGEGPSPEQNLNQDQANPEDPPFQQRANRDDRGGHAHRSGGGDRNRTRGGERGERGRGQNRDRGRNGEPRDTQGSADQRDRNRGQGGRGEVYGPHPRLELRDPGSRVPGQIVERIEQYGPHPRLELRDPTPPALNPTPTDAPAEPTSANPRLILRDPVKQEPNPDQIGNPNDGRSLQDQSHLNDGNRDPGKRGQERNDNRRNFHRHADDRGRNQGRGHQGGRGPQRHQESRDRGERGQDNSDGSRNGQRHADDRDRNQSQGAERADRSNEEPRFDLPLPGERDKNQGVEADRHDRNNEDPRLEQRQPEERNEDPRLTARGTGDRDRNQGRGREGGGPQRAHRRGGRPGGRRRERRNVEIQDLLKEGQEILVQVAKAPIGTKGARLTTHISLPGRNLVLMPTVKHLGISRRIESERERRRLRDIFTKRIRTNGEVGFIIRTVAENKSYRELKADADYLIQLWEQIQERTKKMKAPAIIHEDLGLALKTMRDDFTDDVDSLVIDNEQDYENVLGFISQFSPRLKGRVKLFKGPSQLFEHYGIEAEISRALGKKVWLKSGGYLLIDQSEALTAIDVNTGRYVGSKSLEETILKTNLEAVKEISYQLRIRNVGGIIIIDLIDMENSQNRRKVYDALQEALTEDKAKTNILKISELGLVEMTRKRTHEDLVRYLTEQCSYCEGRGYHKSRRTICFEIFREIEKEAIATSHKNIVVFANSEVVGRITKEEKIHWKGLEERLLRQIVVKADPNFHVEQFEVFSKP